MATDKPPDTRDASIPKYSDPITISTNRLYDLQPYIAFIYREDPQTWGCIFPWEFPQNADRETEEEFIRRYFSEHEVHMQGGAHGDGEGFRFLKQVWYGVALWNLNSRIPLFTRWWLQKPSSIELVNDANMRPFLLRKDVTASTFFPDEMQEYGEKFLKNVVPHLQWTLKERFAKEEAAKKPTLVVDTALAREHSTARTDPEAKPKTAALSIPSVISAAHSAPVAETKPGSMPSKSATQAPQSAPSMPDGKCCSPDQTPVPAPAATQTNSCSLPLKHSSGDKRNFSNNTGGQSQNRQQPGSKRHNYRNQPLRSVHQQAQGQQNAATQHHALSGTSTQFLPAPQLREPLPNMVLQQIPSTHNQRFTYHAGLPDSVRSMYGHVQHGGHQEVHYGGTPLYFSNHAQPLANRSNEQHQMRSFSAEHQGSFFNNADSAQESQAFYQRDSQGPRGVKFRGNHSIRGRGRGRDLPMAADHVRPEFHNENLPPRPWQEHHLNPYTGKVRRGSMMRERNWRSGSDDPQMQPSNWMMQDSAQLHQHPTPAWPLNQPQQTPVYATRPPHESEIERVHMVHEQSQFIQAPQMRKRPFTDRSDLPDLATLSQDQRCGSDWIGKNCTYADTLIVFDVPRELEEEYILDFFSKFGEVKETSRAGLEHDKIRPFSSSGLLFITFAQVTSARKCLAEKPAKWLDNRPLNVEVPKSFWDASHWRYMFAQDADRGFRSSDGHDGHAWAPSILKRQYDSTSREAVEMATPGSASEARASTDTTPTPSGANTPKKKNKPKVNKKNRQTRDQEDLRKSSLAAAVEQLARSQSSEVNCEADQMLKKLHVDQEEQAVGREPFDAFELAVADSEESEEQRSVSGQTFRHIGSESSADTKSISNEETGLARIEVQVASDPAFSPNNDIKAHLSGVTQTPAQFLKPPQPEAQPNALPVSILHVNADDKDLTTRDGSHASTDTSSQSHETPRAMVQASEPPQSNGELHARGAEGHGAEPDELLAATPNKTGLHADSFNVRKDSHAPASKVESAPCSIDNTLPMLELPTKQSYDHSPVLPTPAHMYFTAPSTPAVGPESPIDEKLLMKPVVQLPPITEHETFCLEQPAAVEDEVLSEQPPSESTVSASTGHSQKVHFTEPVLPKKVDKPKGPAQTESFSLFGKRKDSKTKSGKKGSLKGKPKDMSSAALNDDGSITSHRGASVSEASILNLIGKDGSKEANEKDDKNEHVFRDEKIPDDKNKTSKKPKKPKTAHRQNEVQGDSSLSIPTVQDEPTPTKRKGGISGLFSNIFGGGHHSTAATGASPRSRSTSPSKVTPTNKAPAEEKPPKLDHLPKNESVIESAATQNFMMKGTESTAAATKLELDPAVHQLLTSHSIKPDFNDEAVVRKEEPAAGISLEIHNIDDHTSTETALAPRKKANKKRKKNKKPRDSIASADTDSLEGVSTPIIRDHGGSDIFVSPSPDQVDVASENSSTTLGRDTPTSDIQSPTTSSSKSKRLPSRRPGSGQLVEAKTPRWKQKQRRTLTQQSNDEITEVLDLDPAQQRYLTISKDQHEMLDPNQDYMILPREDKKLYVYAGEGLLNDDNDDSDINDDVDAVSSSKLSMERITQLARRLLAKQEAVSSDHEACLSSSELEEKEQRLQH